MSVVDVLEDVVWDDVDCIDNKNVEVVVEKNDVQVEDVSAGCVYYDVVVLFLGDEVVDVVNVVALDAVQVLNLIDVSDSELVLNCFDVDVVDDANELLMADTHDVVVESLDDVTAGFIPMDEMILTEVGVNDVDSDVSPLDAMRLLAPFPDDKECVMSNASH